MTQARENYTPGYTPNAVDFMSRRTAESHAAFFLPHLKPGMRLLDCGCGPGGITVGLAQRVSPGEAIGIDVGNAQLERARQRASGTNLRATFREASAYSLPFRDAEFDAVFSHALFEHLAEPLKALGEIRRVLKTGGCVGLRSPDWGGFVLHPWSESLPNALADYKPCNGRTAAMCSLDASLLPGCMKRSLRGFKQPHRTKSIRARRSSAIIWRNNSIRAVAVNPPSFSEAGPRNRTPHFAQAWFEATGYKVKLRSLPRQENCATKLDFIYPLLVTCPKYARPYSASGGCVRW